MDNLTQMLGDGSFVPYFLFGGFFLIAIVGIIAGTIGGVVKTRARERSRSEIAAYVAEGTITPEHAERLLNAGARWHGCC